MRAGTARKFHPVPDIDRHHSDHFWEKVDIRQRDECWPWRASLDTGGYGKFWIKPPGEDARQYRAHRVAWQIVFGPVPEGLVLDHRCNNRACVNPLHMRPVTDRENSLRGTGPTAVNAAKTHCKHGHEFTTENTILRADGRECLECRRACESPLQGPATCSSGRHLPPGRTRRKDMGMSNWTIHHDHETKAVTIREGSREVARVSDINDALTIVKDAVAIVNARETAEALEEYDAILSRQGDLLTRTVNALRGDPPALTTWSVHDVPELAAAAVAALDDMLGQCEQVQRWVAEGKYTSAEGFNIVLCNANRIRAERNADE